MILELLGLKKRAFWRCSHKWRQISLGWFSKNQLDVSKQYCQSVKVCHLHVADGVSGHLASMLLIRWIIVSKEFWQSVKVCICIWQTGFQVIWHQCCSFRWIIDLLRPIVFFGQNCLYSSRYKNYEGNHLLLGKVPAIITNFLLYATDYVCLKLNQRPVKRPQADSSIVVGENGRRRRRSPFVYQR